jgi:hypothetical protein
LFIFIGFLRKRASDYWQRFNNRSGGVHETPPIVHS